jgi:hypothetical protein
LKRTDSSIKNLGQVEYDKQNWLQHQKTQVWPLFGNCVKYRKSIKPPSQLVAEFGFFDVVANLANHIRLSQGFLH